MTDTSSIDWRTLRSHRRNAVQDMMRSHGFDALLMTGPDNIRYSTDFRSWFIVEAFDWYAGLVTRDGESYIYVPFTDEDISDPDPELPWIKQFIATPSWVSNASQPAMWACAIKKKLQLHKVKKVGIEGLSPAIYMLLIQEIPDVTFVAVDRELALLRQVKHVEEIKLLNVSAKLLSEGSNDTLRFIGPGMTDHEILAISTAKMMASGAEFITHHLCLHREAADWFPHGTALREGDTFAFDIGCYGPGGYGSDMCRTAVVGTPSKVVRDAYKVLMQAYGEGQAAAKPGMKVSELDTIINKVITKSGYPRTPYSMGHGVGMRACELPIIYRKEMMDSDETLQEGMVICLEPETKITVDQTSMVLKIEDMFEVTRTGLRQMTDTRSEI